MLDGRHLWLAIKATSGSLALRDTATGDVVAPSSDLTEEEPHWRSVRMDLAGLAGGSGEATYDVVLVPVAGRSPRPVWAPPLPPARPAQDGTGAARWEVRRTEEGTLRLRRRPLEPAVELRAVSATADGVRLVLAGDAAHLAVLEDGDRVLLTVPTSAGPAEGTREALLALDDLPAGTAAEGRVGCGDHGAWLPVRRRADDLLEPGRGAPLPELESDEGPVLTLHWGQQGLLRARVATASREDER